MFFCNHCTGKSSPQCGVFCDFAVHLVNQNCGRIGHTCIAFLQYVRFSCVSSYGQLWKVTLLTFVRLFSRVDLFVLPHIWQFIWRISTLTALMRLYPCVSHNVGFQSTSLSGWVFALCTSVRLLPRMSDQVSFQISSISALFTIVQLIPRMSLRVTKCFFKCPARPNDLLRCAHLCNFSPVWIIMWFLRWLTHSNPALCTLMCLLSRIS